MVLYDFRKLLLVFLSWNSFMTQVMVKDDEWILTDIYYLENPQVCPSWNPSCNDDPFINMTNCCGYCDCGFDCESRNACCSWHLSFSLDGSLPDKTRSCVKPQFLTSFEDTDYTSDPGIDAVLMITACGQNNMYVTSNKIERLCLNPGSDGHIESLVPVSGSDSTYRNKYCAFCNGLRPLQLDPWSLKFYTTGEISFTDHDEQLLKTIKEQRGNIFYIKPWFSDVEKCITPSYTISKCNETGLWSTYNRSLELACEYLIDPFNITYKNYYCYLCNTQNPDPRPSWQCRDPKDEVAGLQYSNYLTANLAIINEMRNKESLKCDKEKQFPDYKLMKCRNILCDKDQYLSYMKCAPNVTFGQYHCYSILIKLSPSYNMPWDTLADRKMLLDLKKEIMSYFSSSHIVKTFKLFSRSLKRRNSKVVEHAMVQLIIDVDKSQYSLTIFLNNLNGAPMDNVLRNYFDIQLISVDIPTLEKRINIPNIGEFEEFDLAPFDVDGDLIGQSVNNMCLDKSILPFRKRNVCPHVRVGLNEFPFRIEDGNLVFEEDFLHIKYSSWEFERHSDEVDLCLEDYMLLHDVMPKRSLMRVNSSESTYIARGMYLWTYCLLAILIQNVKP